MNRKTNINKVQTPALPVTFIIKDKHETCLKTFVVVIRFMFTYHLDFSTEDLGAIRYKNLDRKFVKLMMSHIKHALVS